jgi:hypothetical protein
LEEQIARKEKIKMKTHYFQIEETGENGYGTLYAEVRLNDVTKINPLTLFQAQRIRVKEITKKEFEESPLVIALDNGEVEGI